MADVRQIQLEAVADRLQSLCTPHNRAAGRRWPRADSGGAARRKRWRRRRAVQDGAGSDRRRARPGADAPRAVAGAHEQAVNPREAGR